MNLRTPRILSPEDPDLTFVALTREDLPLVRGWLARPHVARWYGAPEEAAESIAGHLDEAHIAPYLIAAAGKSLGYLQLYHANDDDFWLKHGLPRETFGLDLFIGEPDALGRGLGTRAIRLAVAHLLSQPDIARIHVDPSPENAVAIRAYAKVGFVRSGDIVTPDGPAAYMILDPQLAILPSSPAREAR